MAVAVVAGAIWRTKENGVSGDGGDSSSGNGRSSDGCAGFAVKDSASERCRRRFCLLLFFFLLALRPFAGVAFARPKRQCSSRDGASEKTAEKQRGVKRTRGRRGV